MCSFLRLPELEGNKNQPPPLLNWGRAARMCRKGNIVRLVFPINMHGKRALVMQQPAHVKYMVRWLCGAM